LDGLVDLGAKAAKVNVLLRDAGSSSRASRPIPNISGIIMLRYGGTASFRVMEENSVVDRKIASAGTTEHSGSAFYAYTNFFKKTAIKSDGARFQIALPSCLVGY
jgi:hypothetical protein